MLFILGGLQLLEGDVPKTKSKYIILIKIFKVAKLTSVSLPNGLVVKLNWITWSENTSLWGSITVHLTCLFCLYIAALFMLNEQQFYLFGKIQSKQVSHTVILPPMVSVLWPDYFYYFELRHRLVMMTWVSKRHWLPDIKHNFWQNIGKIYRLLGREFCKTGFRFPETTPSAPIFNGKWNITFG